MRNTVENNPGRFALGAIASGVVLAFGSVIPGVVLAQEDESTELGTLEVTGSRLKRADAEGALPVTVITRQQIELSGEISVADLLRNSTFNTFGSIKPNSGSSAQAFAQISLRGLGGGRTLVLVDGKRAPLEPSFPEGGQNLNVVPLAAVERIEILQDGASALYGADAVAGVVNIITRKDFNGLEIGLGFGEPTRDGGETEQGSILMGVSGKNTRMMVGASFNNRGIIFQRERPWSSGGASTFSNNYLEVTNDPITGEPTPGAFVNDPANGSKVPGGCSDPGFTETATRCFYDFTLLAADEAEIRNGAFYARTAWDINADWTVNFNASVSRLKSFGRYAPAPVAIFTPESSPNNVYDRDLFIRHRFAALGPRDSYTDNQVYDYDLFLTGVVFDNVETEFGIRKSDSQYNEFGYNYLSIPVAQQFFADGTYDVFDPDGNDPDVLRQMQITINRNGKDVNDYVYANARTDLFQMDAGAVQGFIGFEYREEDYADLYDQQSVAGNVGGSAGNSAFGTRTTRSYFGEVLIPILDVLEADIAARYDSYSDFGSATSPKISFRYQPMDWMTLRTSYGEGFRAPPLPFVSAEAAFSADTVTDAQTAAAFGLPPTTAIQINAFRIANPLLEPEDSKQFSFGIAVEPLDWLNFTLDYYKIEVENQITFFGSSTLLGREGTGLTPPGLGVFRNPDGSILRINTGYGNEGEVKTSGLDLNLKTTFGLGDWGEIKNQAQVSYVFSQDICGASGCTDVVKTDPEYVGGGPEWRAQIQNQWAIQKFTVAWNFNILGHFNTAAGDFGLPGDPEHGTYVTNDVQVQWATPWDSTITAGVDNVFDKDPLLEPYGSRGYTQELTDPFGRVPYLRYTQRF